MPIVKRSQNPAKPASPAPLRKLALKPSASLSVPKAANEKRKTSTKQTTMVTRNDTILKPSASISLPTVDLENSRSFAIADARAKLAEIFDHVTVERARCYVQAGDIKKTRFMTFDYKERFMTEPVMDISINELKSNFSTYSTFVRLGMCFRVSRRTSNSPVFMRRFTRYVEPLEVVMTDYIERRTRKAVEEALHARSESEIEKALNILRLTHENDTAEVLEQIERLSKGIGRMAVNRHPFRDVPLRKDVVVVGDADE